MDIFDILTLIGGLCLFLFGMNVMGDGLERRAGGGLKLLLGKLTNNRMKGFLTGLGVTAVIQSSSATTVMVVGFVNSGLMTLKQSIGVIMGANIGTTVTAWILSLGGISSSNVFVQLLKPTSFTPVLALAGMILLMTGKTDKKKDTGTILLGFATLMFGMDTMSGAVAGLADVPAFRNMFIMFKNPLFGMLAGADGDNPKLIGLRRHFAGVDRHGAGILRRGDSDHHGTKHRNLHNGDHILFRSQQERKACRNRTSFVQRYRHGGLADGVHDRFLCFQTTVV